MSIPSRIRPELFHRIPSDITSHLLMMASSKYSSQFFVAPERMCWLCRRESDILRYNHARNSRVTLFREISFPESFTGEKTTARISPVIKPGHAFRRRFCKRTRSPAAAGGTTPELNTGECPVYNKVTQTWTFRVHADCWDLVSCRVSDPVACATAWCKSLISINWGFADPSPSLKTPELPKELTGTTTPSGRNYRRVSMQRLESFDGLTVELGLDCLPTVHQPVPLTDLGLDTPTTTCLPRPNQAHDPFTALPRELFHNIISYTPTPDLLNLRLASKAIAVISQPASLPRSFWRSRFMPPFEMGFALPEKVDADLDWRGMYFLTRRTLLRHCVVLPRMESPLLARLAKRRYWWERLRRVVEVQEGFEGF